MELALLVYAISVLPNLATLAGLVCLIGLPILLVLLLLLFIELEPSLYDTKEGAEYKLKKRKTCVKWSRAIGVVIAISAVFAALLPSEKTAYIMVGAYATQKIAENVQVQETGRKVLTIIDQKLDQYITEGLQKSEKVLK